MVLPLAWEWEAGNMRSSSHECNDHPSSHVWEVRELVPPERKAEMLCEFMKSSGDLAESMGTVL